jgi:hypothetical protein
MRRAISRESWSEQTGASVLLNNRAQRFGEAVGMVGGILERRRDAHAAAGRNTVPKHREDVELGQQVLCKRLVVRGAGLARDPNDVIPACIRGSSGVSISIRLSYDFSCRLEDIGTAAGSNRSRTAARYGSAHQSICAG